MTERKEVAERSIHSGAGISIRSLEESIARERQLQNQHLDHLGDLHHRHTELQAALTDELEKLEQVRAHLERERRQTGFVGSVRRALAKLPLFKRRILTRRSVEALLRRQYEVSAERLKEAAEFSDKLALAKRDLYDEIERLNQKIIDSAANEKLMAKAVLDIQAELEEKRALGDSAGPGTLEARRIEAEVDRLERDLAESAAKLKLYDTAEERLDRLKESTRKLAQTISELQSDLTFYVTTASEKLDLIAGQIQAIGAAADASLVMLELESSLDGLTESINHTTRFVSETQAYFRERVDGMVEDLTLYDEETEQVLAKNLAMSRLDAEMKLSGALATALRQSEE